LSSKEVQRCYFRGRESLHRGTVSACITTMLRKRNGVFNLKKISLYEVNLLTVG